MRIRSGFVSNSSSTSFLIIAKDELNEENFLQLMGVESGSPIASLFAELYDAVLTKSTTEIDYGKSGPTGEDDDWFTKFRQNTSPEILARIEDAKNRKLKVYFGSFSSDSTLVEQFFCTDSFEAENEKLYFNGLECTW